MGSQGMIRIARKITWTGIVKGWDRPAPKFLVSGEGSAMTVPLDHSIQQAERPGGVFLALFLTLLLSLGFSGCEPSASTPGTRPGGAIPGRPGGARGTNSPGQPSGPSGVKTSASSALKPGGTQTAPLQTAATLVPAKPDSQGAIGSAKAPPEAASIPSLPGVNPLGPNVKVEQAGNTVELASSIIAAKANPFLDWLPKPLLTSDLSGNTSSATASTATPADPFEGVTLLGVMSHGKKAMALIGVGDGQSQFAEQGSVITLGAGMAKVTAIRSDGVDFQIVGKELQTRTLLLPDIVGYSSSSSSGASSGGDAAGAQSMTNLGASGGTASGAANTALDNLRQLFEQSSGGSSSSPRGASTPVNLQER